MDHLRDRVLDAPDAAGPYSQGTWRLNERRLQRASLCTDTGSDSFESHDGSIRLATIGLCLGLISEPVILHRPRFSSQFPIRSLLYGGFTLAIRPVFGSPQLHDPFFGGFSFASRLVFGSPQLHDLLLKLLILSLASTSAGTQSPRIRRSC
jgi:hypothetical protein